MKRGLFIFILLICLVGALGQTNETAPKRVFKGTVTINLGKYEDYYLRIVTGQPSIYVKPGKTAEFNMFVRRGDDPAVVHDVEIIGKDERFQLTVEPSVIPQVRNIDMVVVHATLAVPPDTPEGVYPFKISVKGKEFVEENYPIDTKIQVGGHSILPSIFAMVVSAALVCFLIWRKINLKKLGT